MTEYNLTVSVNREGIPPLIDVVQGDSGRNIVITIADMDISNFTARVYVVKPSGLDVYNNATIEDGKITVELTPQMLAEIGATKMQVSVYNADNERVTTFIIWLNVQESLQDNGLINSSTEYKTLDELIDNASTAVENVTTATDEANKAAASANSAASSANSAASSATTAASNANTATGKANTATAAANSAASSANSAAEAANTAAEAITYPVPIEGGGTGATTTSGALENLGFTSEVVDVATSSELVWASGFPSQSGMKSVLQRLGKICLFQAQITVNDFFANTTQKTILTLPERLRPKSRTYTSALICGYEGLPKGTATIFIRESGVVDVTPDVTTTTPSFLYFNATWFTN